MIIIMQSKLRKLYLYATNSRSLQRDPCQSYEQYTDKKQKHLNNLKALLNSRVELPSIVSIQCRKNETDENVSNYILENELQRSPNQQRRSKHRRNKNKSTYDLPVIGEDQTDSLSKYEVYINEYVEKLKLNNALKDIGDHTLVVKKACEQIKRRIEEELKMKQNDKVFVPHHYTGKKKRARSNIYLKNSASNHTSNHTSNHSSSNHHFEQPLLMKQKSNKKIIADNNLYHMNLMSIEKSNDLKQKDRKRNEKNFVRSLTKYSLIGKNL